MSITYKEQSITIQGHNGPQVIGAQVASNGLAYHRMVDLSTRYTVTHVASGLALDGRYLFHTPQQCERYISLVDCLDRWTKSKEQLETRHYAQLLDLRADLAVAARAVLNNEELLLPYTLKWKIRGQRVETRPILVPSEEEAITRFEEKHQALLDQSEQEAVFVRLFAPNRSVAMREHRFPGIAVPGQMQHTEP